MKEITETDISWRKGFEAGVAFTLRRCAENGTDIGDISKLIGDLQTLRLWKNVDEWRNLVERNCVRKAMDA